jgi:MFS family permease
MPQATSSASSHDVLSDKIPWKPLLPILLFRLADAANYTAAFPFLVDMVTSLRVKPSQIGLYAGLGEGVLMIVEAVAAPFWAKAADRFGRKRTVLLGFILPLLANLLVGFSTRIWQIVLWRSIGE